MAVTANGYSYTVSLIPKAGNYSSSTDISDFVLGIPLLTSTGGDEINSAQIELKSPNGEFLTATPIIQNHDHIRVQGVDRNNNTFDYEYDYYHTDQSLTITESKGVGKIIKLNVQGLEAYTQQVNYIKPIYRESPKAVATDIGDAYNVSRGTQQPELRNHSSNGLPDHIVNNYPYGDAPVNCKDRWQELASSLLAPPENNGVQDYFTVGFSTGGDTFNKIDLSMKSLGSTPTNPITITEGTLATDEDDKQTSFAPAKANRIIGIFNSQAGSLPTGFQKFRGRELRHQFLPSYSNTVEYIMGEQVRDPNNTDILYPVYQAISDVPVNTPLTNRTFWREISYADYLNVNQYSEWTDDKATLYASSGTDPMSATAWGKAMPDFNLSIRHADFFRAPVDYVASRSSDIPDELLYGGTNFYRGFRVLVMNGTGDFSAFDNQVIQYDGSQWRTRYQFTDENEGSVIVDECTGRGYIFENGTFTESNGFQTRDCLHPYSSIENVRGVFTKIDRGQASVAVKNQQSAVEITYNIPSGVIPWVLSVAELASNSPDVVRNIATAAASLGGYFANLIYEYITPDGASTMVTNLQQVNRDFYRAGVSLRFKFPFPSNTFGGITEDIGALYGGSTSTNQEPATFDAQNSHYTHDGLRGYNQNSSEDLGRAHGIGFYNRITQSVVHTDDLITVANTMVRCFIRDTSDHVMYADYNVPFNNTWEPVIIPFSSFKPYFGLPPKELIDFFRPPVQLEQFDEFEFYNIKDIGWTMLDTFDDEGRYDTVGGQTESLLSGAGRLFAGRPANDFRSALQGRTVKFAIDGLRIVKELVVTSDRDQQFNQEEIIRLPDITDDSSGRYFVASEEERLRFQKKNFILDIRGRFDINYGDSIFYRNTETVTDSDSGANTIRLAVNRVEHSMINGGFRTRLYLTKRFE